MTDSTASRSAGRLAGLVAATLVAGALLAVAGCNTTEGFGKDVQAAGEGIEHAAEKNK